MKISNNHFSATNNRFLKQTKIVGADSNKSDKNVKLSTYNNRKIQVSKGKVGNEKFVFDPRNYKITWIDGRELNMLEWQDEMFMESEKKFETSYFDSFYNKSEEDLLIAAKENERQYNTRYAGDFYYDIYDLGAGKKQFSDSEINVKRESSGLGNSISIEKLKDDIRFALSPSQAGWTKEEFSGSIIDVKVGNNQVESLYIHDRLEDAAALYAFYMDKAHSNYQGEELKTVIDSIESEFNNKIEGFAKQYFSDSIYEDAEGIQKSLMSYFEQSKETYSNLIKDFSFDLSEDDNWARNNEYYVTQKLRQSIISQDISETENTKYSKSDIMALSLYQMQSSTYHVQGYETEEELGAQLGILGVQMELITQSYNVSDKVKEQINSAFEARIAQEITNFNERIEYVKTNTPGAFPKLPSYEADYRHDPVNVDVVINTIETTMQALNDVDLEKGLRQAAQDIVSKAFDNASAQKENGTLQARYINSTNRDYQIYNWFDHGYHPQFNFLLNKLDLPKLSSSKNNYDISL